MLFLIFAAIIFVGVTIQGVVRDAKQKPGKPYVTRCPWCGESVSVRSDGSFCCGWCGNFGTLPRMTDEEEKKDEE